MISIFLENINARTFRRINGGLSVVLIIFLFSVFSVSGKSFKEYKENVTRLKEDFSKMISLSKSGEQNVVFEKEVFENAAKLLPFEDVVEFEGVTINVSNKWLTNKVTEYKKLREDSPERKIILAEIFERLEAIELKLDELKSASIAAKGKDSNKQKINEILDREQYGKPQNEEGFLMEWIRKALDWLGSLFPRPKIPAAQDSGFQSLFYVLQILLYVLVAGAIAFVIYKFAPRFINKIKMREKKQKTERVILGEKLSANETASNLFSEAEKLALDGNLKAAIRKGYISLLFELSERKLIGLAKHKTNRDYLRDVSKRRELLQNMNGLTLNYERHWYGFDSIDENDWQEFKSGYKTVVEGDYKRGR